MGSMINFPTTITSPSGTTIPVPARRFAPVAHDTVSAASARNTRLLMSSCIFDGCFVFIIIFPPLPQLGKPFFEHALPVTALVGYFEQPDYQVLFGRVIYPF